MTDLVERFSAAAQHHGERIALIAQDRQISFSELERRASAFAAQCLRKGMKKGDRVLVAMTVDIELYVALAACWRVGAIAVFPEPAMGLAGVRHAIRTTRPGFLFASSAYRLLRLLPELWGCRALCPSDGDTGEANPLALNPDDTALISFTSGSTGLPKAIARSHAFLLAQHSEVRGLLASDRAEVDLVAFPVFVLVNLAEGRTSVLPNWKISKPEQVLPASLAHWCAAKGVTRALLPPSLCSTLAASDIPASLDCVFTGGGPVKPSLVGRLRQKKQGLRIVSVYGSTEAEPIAELDWADVGADDMEEMKNGGGLLVGAVTSGTKAVLREGEILVAGAHVNSHYLDPAMEIGAKVKDGDVTWHRTGDAGRIDEQGRLWLLGRHSAVVFTQQRPLYPFAVEVAAENWPGVRHAALAQIKKAAVLVVEGDIPEEACLERAQSLGIDQVRKVSAMPFDRRHRSKIDYSALRKLL